MLHSYHSFLRPGRIGAALRGTLLFGALLAGRPLAAQTVDQYFYSALVQPYAALTGATTVSVTGGGGTLDEGHSAPITLPFSFSFGPTAFSTVTLSTNGYVGLGAHTAVLNRQVWRGSENQLIAFAGADLTAQGATYRTLTTGQAPNRIFKIEAENFRRAAVPTATGSAQVWLYEGSNAVELHYGAFGAGWNQVVGADVVADTIRVGLRGAVRAELLALDGLPTSPQVSGNLHAGLWLDSQQGLLPNTDVVFRFELNPDFEGPTLGTITATPAGSACSTGPHTIQLPITDASGVAEANLTYRVGTSQTETVVPLTLVQGSWTGVIPNQGTAQVTYYVYATDASPRVNVQASRYYTYADAPVSLAAGPDQSLTAGSPATLTATVTAPAPFRITEFTLNRDGDGATTPYPSYIGPDDASFIEITNLGTTTRSLAGYLFRAYGFFGKSGLGLLTQYSLPQSAVVPAGGVLVLHVGSGLDDPAHQYYHLGTVDELFGGGPYGFTLLDPDGRYLDAVAVNGFSFEEIVATGVGWTGAGVPSSSDAAGASLTNVDLNSATHWVEADAGNHQTIGSLNPGLPLLADPTVTWTGGVLTSPATGATITTPVHAQAGTYTYSASTTTAGCTATDQVVVTVTGGGPCTLPDPGLSFNAPVCEGQPLTLSAANVPGSATYAWTGPNNFTSSDPNPTLTASAAASGTYSLTVTDENGCVGTGDLLVVVNTPPDATLTAVGPTSFCAGDSVVLRAFPRNVGIGQDRGNSSLSGASTSSGFSYAYAVDGTPIPSATADSLVVYQSGTYVVTVTDDETGCSATSAPVTVTVAPLASAAFAYGADGAFCLAAAGTAGPTVSGTAGGTFSADPVGLSLNPQTGVIDLGASAAGTYSVTYAVGETCPASATQQVTLTAPPTAGFSYDAPGPRCVGTHGVLTPTLATGATSGEFTSAQGLMLDLVTGEIELEGSQAGTYWVVNTVQGMGACGLVRDSVEISLDNLPTPDLSSAGATTFCEGDSVLLNASPTGGLRGGPSYTFQFLLDGQPIPGATSSSYYATVSGDYSVVVTNSGGCAATTSAVTVTVNPRQSAAFAYEGSTFCLSGPNPVPTISGDVSGTFSAADGLAIDATTGEVTLSGAAPGTYTIRYTTPGPCAATDSVALTLTTAPSADFAYAVSSPTNPICAGAVASLPPVLGAGASAGTFSADPAGLTVNATTGAIELATSTAGTYVITNSLAATGSCAAVAATATITIEAAPTATLTASTATTFCAGDSVLFTAAGGAAYQFLLDGQPISGATASTFYATQAGAYAVRVTNAAGCAATSAATAVTVNSAQSAAFTYPAATFCLSSANPMPTITGAPGGTFSGATGLVLDAATGALDLAASAAGTYLVSYTTAGPCPATATASVTLLAAPSASFTYAGAGPTGTACAGSATTLTPTLGAGAAAGTFSVSPGGLALDAATGIVNLAASLPGSYKIVNRLAASGGCAATADSITLLVAPAPIAGIMPGGATTFCQGDSVRLTATGGTSYVWSTGATTQSITVGTSGAYSVTVTSAAGCSAVSAATVVTVTPRASAAFAYAGGGAPTYCLGSGATPTPTISGTAGGTFSATPAGLALDPATGALDLAASQAGTYQVQYRTGGPCPDSTTATVTLTPAAQATFAYPAALSCAGVTGTVAPTLAAGSALGTFSATPAGLTLDPATGTVTLATSLAGVYTITNAVAGAAGCASDSATATLTLLALPTVAINGLDLDYCTAHGPITLDGTVNGTGGLGAFTIDGQPATVFDPAALGAGPHVVVFTGSVGGGCEATASLTVNVTATPATPTITVTPQGSGVVVLTSSQPTGNQWFLNGTAIPGATGPTYTVSSSAQNGSYSVQCTISGCPSAISPPQSVIITGAVANLAASTIELYPNPTYDGVVTLALPGATVAAPVRVFDAVGREVLRTTWRPGVAGGAQLLDLRALPTGMYSVRVLTPGGWVTRRLARE